MTPSEVSDPGPGQGSTRDRLLRAAMGIAGRDGLESLTTRRVAKEAGVNVGLVHYYFESKNALVDETMELFLNEMGDTASGRDLGVPEAAAMKPGPEEVITDILTRAINLAARRPGLVFGVVSHLIAVIARSVGRQREDFAEGLALGPPAGQMAAIMKALFGRIKPLLVESLGDDPALVGRRSIQLFTSIFHPIIFSPLPYYVFGVRLNSEAERAAYVRGVVRDALRPPMPL